CTRTLDFTRDEPPSLIRRRFPLAGLVADVAEALAVEAPGVAGGPGPRVENAVPGTIEIDGDRDQLYRVVFNLCRNALEAGAHHVRLAAERSERQIAVTIADDGPGLPPKARDNLFQPFTGSARLGGTGLGLAIARELTRPHGGD